jgi:hypothetical protein
VLVFAPAEEVLAGLTAFASDRGIAAASVVAIGGLSAATLGFFDVERKTYERLPVMEQVEVLSMAGNVAVDEQHRPKVHVHVVLGRRDGSVCGGHLLDARVRPTLEVVLQESPRFLRRRARPDLGLALLDLDRAPASR